MDDMTRIHEAKHNLSAKFSIRATEWVGTTSSLVVHTVIFLAALLLPYFGLIPADEAFLILTTVVSLEAIYLAIFIQMTVNRNNQSLAEVEKDIDEIQEDVGEIGEDIEELSEDVEELSEDIDEIQEDIGEISEDIDEIQEEDSEDEVHEKQVNSALQKIEVNLQQIINEIEALKSKK